MYTPEEVEQILIDYLTPGFAGFYDGEIVRKDDRLGGSLEDLVVSTLSLTDGDVQRGFILVTIYVKDVSQRNEAANQVDVKPNTTRINEFTSKVYDVLNGNAGKYWKYGNLWITNPSPIYKNAGLDEHFRTIRVAIKAHLPTPDLIE